MPGVAEVEVLTIVLAFFVCKQLFLGDEGEGTWSRTCYIQFWPGHLSLALKVTGAHARGVVPAAPVVREPSGKPYQRAAGRATRDPSTLPRQAVEATQAAAAAIAAAELRDSARNTRRKFFDRRAPATVASA
ncbi:hypothetical protein MRX96_018880 [Rhipicephalus microplus]